MLTLKWRDYADEGHFRMHVTQVALQQAPAAAKRLSRTFNLQ